MSKGSFGGNKKKNIIWVITDQMRAQAMGFMGDPNVRTPNLDNMAREGVAFTSAISGAPWCCPFRGALLTGQYPHVNGVVKTPMQLSPSAKTIVSPLKDNGYHTAWVGKWHLDGSNHVTHYVPPENRAGFDYFMGYENNNNQNESYVFGNDCEEFTRIRGYETDALNDIFINHIRAHVGDDEEYQPFFAVLSIQPPHTPYVTPYDETGTAKYYKNPHDIKLRANVPPGKWADEAKFTLAGYYGMIENIDANIGKLRRSLQDMGIDRDTYIMFMSDHGDMHGSHGQSQKSTPWEESIRIPFIVSSVGSNYHMKSGDSKALINHVDIAPTTLGLCGIDVPETMQGYDYSSLCLKTDDASYKQNPAEIPQSAYLQQIVRKRHPHSINKQWRAVVTMDGYKYVCFPNTDAMLFNLNEDPYEMANICFDQCYYEEKVRLHKILQQYIIDLEDDFELPDIDII